MTLLDERRIRPMLAETSDPFDSPNFLFEPKWDGQRSIAYVRSGKIEFQNRNLIGITNSYPELKGLSSNINSDAAVLDGEIVVLEDGLPSFESLQTRFGVTDSVQIRSLASRAPATYIAFDLLHLDGEDLIDQPLLRRRKQLARTIRDGPHILLSQYILEKGKSYFGNAVRLGFEGIMAKNTNSPYQIGVRSRDWVKIKHVKTLDCIIAGFTRGEGGRAATFGALVLAAYDKRTRIVHLGNVGTGFTDRDLKGMSKILRTLTTKTRTIPGEVKAPSHITWVRPKLVAEVGYMSLTRDTKLRFPRFVRLRLDANAEDCVL